MRVFKVGGCVRDRLLGLEPKDIDWLVVGATEQDMIDRGFNEVGKDFGVWLHPESGDEWALARRERSTGNKHTDFVVELDGVSLEDDLKRRDLTINAMCVEVDPDTLEELTGEIIDPFGGQKDLENKLLHPVSMSFLEDPLRVLRIGRFLARFGDDWNVSGDALWMSGSVDLDSLTPERIWSEMERALMEKHPDRFFKWMCSFDMFPELDALKTVAQKPKFHPEGDAFVHTMLCLRAAVELDLTLEERFAVLCHDLGKKPIHDLNLGHHGGHEKESCKMIDPICDRWKIPNDCRKLAKLVAFDHTHVHNIAKLRAKTVAKIFERWDILRHPERTEMITNCCWADASGRGSGIEDYSSKASVILLALEWLKPVDVDLIQSGRREPLKGKAIGDAIRRERLKRLEAVKKELKDI